MATILFASVATVISALLHFEMVEDGTPRRVLCGFDVLMIAGVSLPLAVPALLH